MTNEIEGGMANDQELLNLLKSWKARRALSQENADTLAKARPTQTQPQPQPKQPTLAELGLTREEILKMVQEEVKEAQASATEETMQYTMSVLKNFGMTQNSPKTNLGMGEPFRLGRRISKGASEDINTSGQ